MNYDIEIKNKVLALSKQLFPEIQAIRRHIHAHPELSFLEFETAKYIQKCLLEKGIKSISSIANTGWIVDIEGTKLEGNKNQTFLMRADIDALPIQECNTVSYGSQNKGIMHACGHDVHTSSMLGACFILQELRPYFSGTVRCLFQPGEEQLPGGASIMIKEGALEIEHKKGMIGQHVHPPLEAGKIGLKPGQYMASADEIILTVNGRGGHAALPNDVIDPILAASQILIALQQVISRKSSPGIPSVLSFGKINSDGGAFNVIPESVTILGTFRTMDETWRYEAHKWIRTIAENTAKSTGATCDVLINVGYPSLINDHDVTNKTKELAIQLLGEENVVDLPMRMTAEDFSYYSQATKSCFYRLGTGNHSKGITSPVHTNTFNIDEEALKPGMALPAWVALNYLQ